MTLYQPGLGEYVPTLKHCPFCGGPAEVHYDLDIGDQPGAGLKIGCSECEVWFDTHYANYFPLYSQNFGNRQYSGKDSNKEYASMLEALLHVEQWWNGRRDTPAKVFYVRENDDTLIGSDWAKPGWYAGELEGDSAGPFRFKHEAMRDPLA
jgi:hypothetical protein